MRTALTAHIDAMVAKRANDPEHRRNRREIAAQRNAGVGAKSTLGDAIEREMTSEAREDADEAVTEARDVRRRLRLTNASRAELAAADEAVQVAMRRRKELNR